MFHFKLVSILSFFMVASYAKPPKTQKCMNLCQSKHSAAFHRVLPKLPGEQFIVFPFRSSLFDNFELYCVILESLTNCYKDCGMENPSKTLSYLTEYILCRNKAALLPKVQCMTDHNTEHCATECWNQQRPRNDSVTLRKLLIAQCDSMRCSVKSACAQSECKSLFHDYYKAFATSRRHLLGCWLLLEQLQVEAKKLVTTTDSNKMLIIILLSTLVPLAFVSVVAVSLAYLYQTRWKMYSNMKRLTSDSIHYKIHDKLATGHFGEIYKGTLTIFNKRWFKTKKVNRQNVLVEALSPESTKRGFLIQVFLLSKLNNDYVVQIKGVCLDSKPVTVALEFLDGGSLDKYLQSPHIIQALESLDLWRISMDIALGGQYLHQKGLVHRDLRSKSCLIQFQSGSYRPEVTKIYNFGFAKSKKSKKHRIQQKQVVFEAAFTAPEGFEGTFGPKYDIWSYGVLLWEVWSWVSKPYGPCNVHIEDNPCCSIGNQHIPDVAEIQRLVTTEKKSLKDWMEPCGANYSPSIKRLMESCWLFEPNLRPSFAQVIRELQDAKEQLENFVLNRPSNRSRGGSCIPLPRSFLSSHSYCEMTQSRPHSIVSHSMAPQSVVSQRSMMSPSIPLNGITSPSLNSQSTISQRQLCTDLLYDAVTAFLDQQDEEDDERELEDQSQAGSYATTTSAFDEVSWHP